MSGQALAVLISIQSVLLGHRSGDGGCLGREAGASLAGPANAIHVAAPSVCRWRRAAVWMHALGLFGSVALAIRLMAERQVAAALWSVSLPVIGVALGSFGGWHGMALLQNALFAVWPCVPVTVVAVYVAWRGWRSVMLAFVCAGFAVGASLTTLAAGWCVTTDLAAVELRCSGPSDAPNHQTSGAALGRPGVRRARAGEGAKPCEPLYSTIANVLILTLLFGRMGAPLFQPGATLDIAQAWGSLPSWPGQASS